MIRAAAIILDLKPQGPSNLAWRHAFVMLPRAAATGATASAAVKIVPEPTPQHVANRSRASATQRPVDKSSLSALSAATIGRLVEFGSEELAITARSGGTIRALVAGVTKESLSRLTELSLQLVDEPVPVATASRAKVLMKELILSPHRETGDEIHGAATPILCLVQAFTDLGLFDQDLDFCAAAALRHLGRELDDPDERYPSRHDSAEHHGGLVASEQEPRAGKPHVQWSSRHVSVIVKPPGWSVFTSSDVLVGAKHLVSWVQANSRQPIVRDRQADYGFVHRLDRNTSGSLLLAQSYEGYFAAKLEFNARRVTKQYVALCEGHFPKDLRMLSFPLLTVESSPGTFRSLVDEAGQHARTEVLRVAHLRDASREAWSLLIVRLHTGRTHQIRAHCAALGHPLAADQAYGGKSLASCKRVFLHSFRLHLASRGEGDAAGWVADAFSPLPEDLQQALAHMSCETADCAATVFTWLKTASER
eukprot:s2_g18.t1